MTIKPGDIGSISAESAIYEIRRQAAKGIGPLKASIVIGEEGGLLVATATWWEPVAPAWLRRVK